MLAQRAAVQRDAACPAPPVAPPGTTPAGDPKFAAVKSDLAAKAKTAKAHPPAAKEAKAAQDAAVAPADDKEAQAKAAHAGKMEAAKPGTFDKAAFVAAVKAAIAAKAPKSLDEADKFATSGKADQVKNEVMGKVTAGKESSVKQVAEATKATPDSSAAKEKPVTPLPPPAPAPALAPPDPKAAAPKPAPPEQTQLGAGSCETSAKMAEAGVTEDQLAKSNEPELTGALDAKKEAEKHDATAPAQVKAQEGQLLAGATAQAAASGKAGVSAMGAAKVAAGGKTASRKDQAKAKEEAERARITTDIKKIFDTTKTDVEKILGDLDGTVTKMFEDGEREAKAAFTADHQKRMSDYKRKRYGGVLGPQLWLKDLLLDMPAEANNLFVESKKLYENKMEAVISAIADKVGAELGRAKARVAEGRAKVTQFVAEQPKNLQKMAGEAAQQMGSQFDDLEKTVDEKQAALVEDLAEKYVEARNAVDEEIKKLQEENKGLVSKAADAVGGAIETIKKLKDMLLGVLARAAGAVEKIIKDPMDFLKKFINAVKAGVMGFLGNILTHLKKGLQGWLFGALAEAGIEIPDKFDLKGIISLVLSLLGLTWNAIRSRIVKVVGEPAMKVIEGAVDFVKAVVTEGIPGLWKWIATKVSDLKEQVMSQIKEFVITKIITAGITWLISLLNPAAAFIKACKMIYDAVMWFVDNAERLKDFVSSILDSVEEIASGGVSKVAAYIEGTMAKIVPLLISGLASLLGLGGIADKIKKVLEIVQKPVAKAVDWLVGKAVKYGKGFIARLKRSKLGKAATKLKDKAKATYAKGKAWVKAKYEKGKAWVKEKAQKGTAWIKEKLGLVKHPFRAGRESHSLSIGSSGKILMASDTPEPVETKLRRRYDAMRGRWAKAGRQLPDRDTFVAGVVAQIREAERRISAAGEQAPGVAKQAFEKMAPLIADLLVNISGVESDAHPQNEQGVVPNIGKIAPWSSNKGSNRTDPARERHLESEHVIDHDFLSRVLASAGFEPLTAADKNRQHTIMIYKTAANKKNKGVGGAFSLRSSIRELLDAGTPNLEGLNADSRQRKGSAAAVRGWRERARERAPQIKASFIEKVGSFLGGLVGKLAGTVRADHPGKEKVRGHEDVRPTEDQIRHAASLQVVDVAECLRVPEP